MQKNLYSHQLDKNCLCYVPPIFLMLVSVQRRPIPPVPASGPSEPVQQARSLAQLLFCPHRLQHVWQANPPILY